MGGEKMSEYWFCVLVMVIWVALTVALTGLCYLFDHLRYKHKTKQRKSEYKQLKRLQRKEKLVEQYAEFVAIATAYGKNTKNYCFNCGQALDWNN